MQQQFQLQKFEQGGFMGGFTKLFSSIVQSTIWREPDTVRLVWITMLALSDKNGYVNSSIPGLADAARVSIPDAELALKTLQNPDPYSRSKENDGRRIQEVDGGWFLLNYGKYRKKLSLDERRAYFREYRRIERAAKSVQLCSQMFSNVQRSSTMSHIAEAEAEAEAYKKTKEEEGYTGNGRRRNRGNGVDRSASRIGFDAEAGGFINIPEATQEIWEKAFPAVNIPLELNKMTAWLIANPEKKKKRYDRFISNWLSRTQDKGGSTLTGKYPSNSIDSSESLIQKTVARIKANG